MNNETVNMICKILIEVIMFFIGASCFSFANVVIYRLPEKKTLIKGKSMCRACEHELAAKDIIPIFSWIFLKGKCRYCGEKISPRYTVVELIGGAIATGLHLYYGFSLRALIIFLFFGLLTIIFCIDYDTMEIPPQLNLAILLLGIPAIWIMPEVTILQRIIGMFCISLPLYLIILVVPDGFGGGDIKMMFAAGFLLGWKGAVMGFMIGLITGGIYGVICLIQRKMGKKDHFAFGPFLAVGLSISTFVGPQILDWYVDFVKSMMLMD